MKTVIRILTLVLGTSFGLAAAAGAAHWLEIRTDHFTVFTNAGETAGTAAADRLEALHRALSRMAGTPRQTSVPTKVYVFVDDEALQPFKPAMAAGRRGSGRAVAGGFFAPRELGNYVAVNAGTAQPISSTIQHELLHQFATQNLPRLPFWFNEGLAEYYSTFEVRDGVGIIGRPHAGNLRRLASSPTGAISKRTMDRVTALSATKELYDDAGGARQAYALSWVLVHYLLSNDRHAESTLEFMRGLARGLGPDEAFEDAFGREPSSFAGALARYVIDGRFPEFEIDLSRVVSPSVRRLSGLERDLALFELALVVSKGGLASDLLNSAWTEFDRTDSASPDLQAGLHVAQGRLHLLNDDPTGARFALQQAVQLAPSRVDASLYLARALLQIADHLQPGDVERMTSIESARKAALRASDLAPDLVAALDTLAQTWIVEAEHVRLAEWPPDDLDQGVRALETALEQDRYRADLATKLAVLHALGEDLASALGTLRRHRLRYSDPSLWEAALDQSAQIELRLLRMRTAGPLGPANRDPMLDELEHRAAALMEFTYEFNALSHLFADAQALEEDLTQRRRRSESAAQRQEPRRN